MGTDRKLLLLLLLLLSQLLQMNAGAWTCQTRLAVIKNVVHVV
jgi:hypothetical protein